MGHASLRVEVAMTLAEELQRELDEIRKQIEWLWRSVMRVEKRVGVKTELMN